LEELGPTDHRNHVKTRDQLIITMVIVVLEPKNRKFATIPRAVG
jgi:hypothetical protein